MRPHRRVARLHIRGQVDVDRRGLATLLAPALQREADGIGMRHVAVERLADGGLQVGGAVAIEQPRQSIGDGAEIGAALGGAQQQVLAGRSDLGEAVGGAMLSRGAFLGD